LIILVSLVVGQSCLVRLLLSLIYSLVDVGHCCWLVMSLVVVY